MTILFTILGFLVGLVVSHHYIVEPLLDTESELRKELKKVRRDQAIEEQIRFQRVYHALHTPSPGDFGWYIPKPTVVFTPESKVPHRAHSPVLKINSIDDLIEGTKP